MKEFSAVFHAAREEYAYLLDRGYTAKSSLKIVGDRRRLDAEERIILFRGIAPKAEAASRRAKLGLPQSGAIFLVDLYNVALTLVHYLIGKPCFICSDGLLRDAGANYGRLCHDRELERAFTLLASRLGEIRPQRIEAFLDAPVTHSGEHAAAFRSILEAAKLSTSTVTAARSADGAITSRLAELSPSPLSIPSVLEAGQPREAPPVWVLSSDSVLVDRAARVFDAARHILETDFKALLPGLSEV